MSVTYLVADFLLIYSPPPLLTSGAFAWCIWAMGLPPAAALENGARPSVLLGSVGLMDLDDLKKRVGGWVASGIPSMGAKLTPSNK